MLVRRSILVLALAASCAPTTPATRSVGVRAETLEAELAQLPSDPSPASTIQRSRLLRALGRQQDALTQLDTALDGARGALDWRGMSNLWRELGDVQIELARPQDALETYAKRLTNAKSLRRHARSSVRAGRHGVRIRVPVAVDTGTARAGRRRATRKERPRDRRRDAREDGLRAREAARTRRRDRAVRTCACGDARNQNPTGEARAAIARAYCSRSSKRARRRSMDRSTHWSRQRAIQRCRFACCAIAARHCTCSIISIRAASSSRAKVSRSPSAAAFVGSTRRSICWRRCAPRRSATSHRRFRRRARSRRLRGRVAETSVPSARQAAGFEALLLYRHILALDVKLPERDRVAAAFAAMEKARGRA